MFNSVPRRIAIALMFLLLPLPGVLSAPNGRFQKTQRAHLRSLKPQDESLREAVKAEIAKSRSLAGMDIQVEVSGGVVTLSGTVSSQARKKLAVRIASRVKGTKRVVDRITIGRKIFTDYECCCNGECWTQSRPCSDCSNQTRECIAEFQQAMQAADTNAEKRAARQKFYDCIHKQY
ncbi:MAG TPA: BON domain-containing protein [Pyrinomonadaceae bacterium]|jgi:hypothetical protein